MRLCCNDNFMESMASRRVIKFRGISKEWRRCLILKNIIIRDALSQIRFLYSSRMG